MKSSVPKKIVLIGASTGGPGQIKKIIKALPNLYNTSIIVAQHMVEGFLASFRNNLQDITHNKILLANNKDQFKNATIYICEGETQLKQNDSQLSFSQKASQINSYNPNINLLFNSFIPFSNDIEILCIILTGIGDDGVEACKNLSTNGARCMTESAHSAIVDGMPSRARLLVSDIEIHAIDEIINNINGFCT